MRRSAPLPLALLFISFAGPVLAEERPGSEAPRLDYRMDDYQDSHVTYGGEPHGYSGRWTGTWQGADRRRYSGTYEGRFEGRAETREVVRRDGPQPPYDAYGQPDPAFYGSGQVIGGWYYPPAVVTRTVVEYHRSGLQDR